MGQDPSSIRSEIAATRDRMDDTIDALQYKTDVPARVGDRIDAIKETLGDAATTAASRASDVATAVASRTGDAATAVVSSASDSSQTVAAAVGAAVDTAKQTIANLVPGATPSGASTSLHTTAEDDIDVQED